MAGVPAQHPKVVSFRRNSSPSHPYAEVISEQSPLIGPRRSSEVDGVYKVVSPLGSDDWQGDADEETKSSWYLFLLTLGGLGLQIGWSVETSNGSVSGGPTALDGNANVGTAISTLPWPQQIIACARLDCGAPLWRTRATVRRNEE